MEDYDPSTEPIAFDMGISTLTRINYWLWKCDEAQSQDNIDLWFKGIRILFKETFTFMKDDQQKTHKETMKKVEEAYKKYLNYQSTYAYNSVRNPKTPFNPPREIFDLLNEWECDLRVILDKVGILMRKGEDASKAMM